MKIECITKYEMEANGISFGIKPTMTDVETSRLSVGWPLLNKTSIVSTLSDPDVANLIFSVCGLLLIATITFFMISKIFPKRNTRTTARARSLTFSISEKGCVCVKGLGRFPTSLYKNQWIKLLENIDELRQFLIDNDAELRRFDKNSEAN